MYWRRRASAISVSLSLALGLAVSVLAPQTARADHKVYSPIVEGGETEIEFRGHHDFDGNGAIDGGEKWKFTVGHGFTNRWFSEAVFEWEKAPGAQREFAAVEWENVIQLTEQGRYWADWGVLAEYASERGSGPDKIELGALMAKEFGRRLMNLNLIFEKEVGSGASSDVEVEYAWDYRWRGNPKFEFGLQGYGELGELGDFEFDSEHLVGPAFYGKIPGKNRTAWKYDAALLLGLTDQSPDATLRFQVEFEF